MKLILVFKIYRELKVLDSILRVMKLY